MTSISATANSTPSNRVVYWGIRRRKNCCGTGAVGFPAPVRSTNQRPPGDNYLNYNPPVYPGSGEGPPSTNPRLASAYDLLVNVKGGGPHRHPSDAIKQGAAVRLRFSPPRQPQARSRPKATSAGIPPRPKSRRKYGLKKARKAPQFLQALIPFLPCPRPHIHPTWYHRRQGDLQRRSGDDHRLTQSELHVDVWSGQPNPFIGNQKILDPKGRVDRFHAQYGMGNNRQCRQPG